MRSVRLCRVQRNEFQRAGAGRLLGARDYRVRIGLRSDARDQLGRAGRVERDQDDARPQAAEVDGDEAQAVWGTDEQPITR